MKKKIRVLIAKPGLDGHDRGALIISQALRDYGMEVIYTGLRQTPEQIVSSAIQEDVDAIGMSCLSGAHNDLFPEVVKGLKKHGAEEIIVVGGGVIPWEDIPFLEEQGVQKIFTPGTPSIETAKYIEKAVYKRDGIGLDEDLELVKKIDHIGIAVNSLDESIPFYLEVLQLKLEGIEEVPSESVKVAFINAGNIRLELLEPTNEKSSIHTFIEKHGAGIHHVALGVANIEQRIKELKKKGITMIHNTPKSGAGGAEIAFMHPKSTQGVLYELCDKSSKESQ
ncbi:methylmalonyl-CoA epimerase [Pseudalkalibacillus decolorationis]|uniref:methylmalonyl-CoA epimerase n=1 Tax=Pseudalkalibacillus decolorationis TaxID=163879 RepID=UPI0021480DA4|nr:methylmalonyl-CoA epimerase [Pseudalkalibacillus decolorationis]